MVAEAASVLGLTTAVGLVADFALVGVVGAAVTGGDAAGVALARQTLFVSPVALGVARCLVAQSVVVLAAIVEFGANAVATARGAVSWGLVAAQATAVLLVFSARQIVEAAAGGV